MRLTLISKFASMVLTGPPLLRRALHPTVKARSRSCRSCCCRFLLIPLHPSLSPLTTRLMHFLIPVIVFRRLSTAWPWWWPRWPWHRWLPSSSKLECPEMTILRCWSRRSGWVCALLPPNHCNCDDHKSLSARSSSACIVNVHPPSSPRPWQGTPDGNGADARVDLRRRVLVADGGGDGGVAAAAQLP